MTDPLTRDLTKFAHELACPPGTLCLPGDGRCGPIAEGILSAGWYRGPSVPSEHEGIPLGEVVG